MTRPSKRELENEIEERESDHPDEPPEWMEGLGIPPRLWGEPVEALRWFGNRADESAEAQQ